jgi:hypothetical protein
MVGIVFRRIEGIKTATSKAKKNPLLLPFFHCSDEKKRVPFSIQSFKPKSPLPYALLSVCKLEKLMKSGDSNSNPPFVRHHFPFLFLVTEMSSTLEKGSADLQSAEHKKQNLCKAFNHLKTHAAAVANFALQWQDLEDHFLSIHNSIQAKLQAEKTQLATTPQSLANFQ